MLNARQMENSEQGVIELNCSSSRQSFGNGAEFIVNGQTIEHISFNNNKCYNSKIEECTTEHCQCFPRDNIYIYKFENVLQYHKLIIGCLMRFSDNETGSIMKAVISLKFNGTVSEFHEYDVKVFNQDKEENGDNNINDSSSANKFIWVPVMCGILLVISVAVIGITCRVKNYAFKRINKNIDERVALEMERTKDIGYEIRKAYKEISEFDSDFNKVIEASKLVKTISRRWYRKKIAQLTHQGDAIDNRIKESILEIVFEIENEIVSCKDTSWRASRQKEVVDLDNIHSIIQEVIKNIIQDRKHEIKQKALRMHGKYPFPRRPLLGRRSSLKAIFEHIGGEDNDERDDSDDWM